MAGPDEPPAPPHPHRLAGAAGVYAAGAVVVTARVWRDPAHLTVAGNANDTDLFTWWLAWVAHGLGHAALGFRVPLLNAPVGVSALWNTSLLLPGVLLSPVTWVFGAQVSYAVLLVVGFAGSALSAYLLLRRHLDAGPWSALAGGAIYGFSPAMTHAAIGHAHLVLAVLVPLLVSASLDLLRGRVGPVRGGVRLGVLAAAQLLTGEELLYLTVVGVALLVLLLVVARPRAALERARPVGRSLGVAALTAVVLIGYPVGVQLVGPLAQHGSPFSPDFFTADLAGLVTPPGSALLRSATSAAAAGRYRGGPPEYLAYLGWPLVMLCLLVLLGTGRDLRLRVAAGLTALLASLSLGRTVLFHGADTRIPGPWQLLQHLPLADGVVVTRFGLLAALAAGALLARTLDLLTAGPRGRVAAFAVGGLVLLPLLPRPLAVEPVAPVPAGFVAAARSLPAGGTTLVVPVPTGSAAEPMRWQVAAGFRFAMPGGYFIGPGPGGQAYVGGGLARPTQDLLTRAAAGQLTAAALTPADRAAAVVDLAYWRLRAVLLVDRGTGERGVLEALLGPATRQEHTVLVWERPVVR